MLTVRKGLLLVFVALLVLLVVAGAAFGATPKRVMIVVMDQMQPGYAQQYDMQNVLWLENHGVNFKRAYVGDMASETVVSHNVMVSGLFPKHMGWSDEAIRDVDNVLGYGYNAIVTVGDLGTADYVKLIDHYGPYPKLGDYLKAKFPGTIIANVGEKGYQVETMAAKSSDMWVRMGSKKKTADLPDPSVLPWSGTYRGAGGNPPSYIKSDPRFMVSVANNSTPNDYYGTKVDKPAWMYPEDGRYVAGVYPGHESGDIWVADAALKIMDHENWSGLWVTFSAIDKVGHMWGGGAVDTLETYKWDPDSIFREVHMPWAAKNADDQLGRLIAKLKEKGQFDDTLIIVTADHGSTYGGKGWYGDNVYDGGNTNGWYAGGPWWPSYTNTTDPTKDPNFAPGPSALKPLMDTGLVEFSYQSTSIESWLKDPTAANKATAADVMATLPGVIATFVKAADDDSYKLVSKGAMTPAERRWFNRHGQELVNTMAFEGSGDVVGLLANKTVYSVYGDHGGAQKDVQRIPMAFWSSSVQHVDRGTPFRLADITPTILRTLGITPTAPMDGSAQNLPMRGGK